MVGLDEYSPCDIRLASVRSCVGRIISLVRSSSVTGHHFICLIIRFSEADHPALLIFDTGVLTRTKVSRKSVGVPSRTNVSSPYQIAGPNTTAGPFSPVSSCSSRCAAVRTSSPGSSAPPSVAHIGLPESSGLPGSATRGSTNFISRRRLSLSNTSSRTLSTVRIKRA